jgi:hypothetical protein
MLRRILASIFLLVSFSAAHAEALFFVGRGSSTVVYNAATDIFSETNLNGGFIVNFAAPPGDQVVAEVFGTLNLTAIVDDGGITYGGSFALIARSDELGLFAPATIFSGSVSRVVARLGESSAIGFETFGDLDFVLPQLQWLIAPSDVVVLRTFVDVPPLCGPTHDNFCTLRTVWTESWGNTSPTSSPDIWKIPEPSVELLILAALIAMARTARKRAGKPLKKYALRLVTTWAVTPQRRFEVTRSKIAISPFWRSVS